jgi:hypothetical protein
MRGPGRVWGIVFSLKRPFYKTDFSKSQKSLKADGKVAFA